MKSTSMKLSRRKAGYRRWSVAEIALLGTMTDREVAKRTKRGIEAVRNRRRILGIKSVQKARPWTKKELALLGTMPDSELAAKLKRTFASVACRRNMGKIPAYASPMFWTAEEMALPGTDTDEKIAKRLKRTVGAVMAMRARYGISQCQLKKIDASTAILIRECNNRLRKLLKKTAGGK